LKKPFLGVFLMNQPVPPAPTPLNMRVSPENRAKFTGFLEGVRSKAVTSQMPPPMPMQPGMMPQGQGMGMPPMPPQGMMPPMQPPMMPPRPMNMGGMVDVFDPRYMNEGGFVISTDDSGKIATRPVFSEDRGRMVSQILSRDMVDEMEKAAMAKANQPKPSTTPSLGEIISEKIIEEKILDNAQRADDSLKGVPDFTTTTVEPETATIALPTPKPKVQLPVSKPKFSNIEVPVSKPRITTIGDIDPFSYFDEEGPDQSLTFEKLTKPFVQPQLNVSEASRLGVTKPEYQDPEELRDAAIYSDIRDIDDLGTLGATIPPEEMKTIARMVTEGEKLSGPDVNIFDVIPLIDRFGEMDLVTDEVPKLRKLTGLEKLLKFIFPKSGFNQQFTAPSGQGIDSFNTGGIVQGFSNGGFTTNLRAAEPERARQIEEDAVIRDVLQQYDDMYDDKDRDDLGSATPIFKTVGEGRSPVSGNVYDAYTSKPIVDANLAFGGSDVFSTPYADEGFAKAEANPLNKYVAPVTNFIAGLQTNPNTGQKFDMSNTSDRYDYYNLTQQTKEASERAAEARRRDQDRAERKLAEEQRLRDMIQGMLPPTAATAPTAPIADASTVDPVTPDYGSVVVPSDRVPGFDVGNISPYPQFRMPTEFSPVFPTSLSANYFKDLFKNIGVQNMQQGGSVNQLDSAIDNFINAYR
tara:strand:- start:15257 stop:17329 length:2073 start_codon:yes stop_codon:yes gene_type:complete